MTNGEKFQQIFAISQVDECDLNVYAWLPCHDAIDIPLEWWNAEYKEPSSKNDLGVDAVSRQAVIDLMMQKWGENFSGDDAMQESIDAIREMPSVTPQEPILDKIRAEITGCLKALDDIEKFNIYLPNEMTGRRLTYQQCLGFIDKYKAESEPQESEE